MILYCLSAAVCANMIAGPLQNSIDLAASQMRVNKARRSLLDSLENTKRQNLSHAQSSAKMAKEREKFWAEHNAWKIMQAEFDAEARMRNEKATGKKL